MFSSLDVLPEEKLGFKNCRIPANRLPVGYRASGTSRERSGEEGVRRGAPPPPPAPRPTRFARGVTTL